MSDPIHTEDRGDGRSRVYSRAFSAVVTVTLSVQRDPMGYVATVRRAGNCYPGEQVDTCVEPTYTGAVDAALRSAGLSRLVPVSDRETNPLKTRDLTDREEADRLAREMVAAGFAKPSAWSVPQPVAVYAKGKRVGWTIDLLEPSTAALIAVDVTRLAALRDDAWGWSYWAPEPNEPESGRWSCELRVEPSKHLGIAAARAWLALNGGTDG